MTNAKNVRVKPVELKIDDEVYLIKYDFNAFIELEEEYGSIDIAMEKLQGEVIKDDKGKPVMIKDEDGKDIEKRTFSLKVMRDFLWCGLLYDKPDFTKRDAGKMLELANFKGIVEIMMQAIVGALPQKVEEDVGDAKN